MTFPFPTELKLIQNRPATLTPVPSPPPLPAREDSGSRTTSARWDYLTEPTGRRSAWLCEITETGCVLRTAEPLDSRRWLRLAYHDEEIGLFRARSGRIIKREDRIEAVGDAYDSIVTLHRYQIEFEPPRVG